MVETSVLELWPEKDRRQGEQQDRDRGKDSSLQCPSVEAASPQLLQSSRLCLRSLLACALLNVLARVVLRRSPLAVGGSRTSSHV